MIGCTPYAPRLLTDLVQCSQIIKVKCQITFLHLCENHLLFREQHKDDGKQQSLTHSLKDKKIVNEIKHQSKIVFKSAVTNFISN
jgi:hypothetical protein